MQQIKEFEQTDLPVCLSRRNNNPDQIGHSLAGQAAPNSLSQETTIFLVTKEGYFHDCCGMLLGIHSPNLAECKNHFVIVTLPKTCCLLFYFWLTYRMTRPKQLVFFLFLLYFYEVDKTSAQVLTFRDVEITF